LGAKGGKILGKGKNPDKRKNSEKQKVIKQYFISI